MFKAEAIDKYEPAADAESACTADDAYWILRVLDSR